MNYGISKYEIPADRLSIMQRPPGKESPWEFSAMGRRKLSGRKNPARLKKS